MPPEAWAGRTVRTAAFASTCGAAAMRADSRARTAPTRSTATAASTPFARGTNTAGEFGASALFGSASRLRHHANVTFANLKSEFVDQSFTDPTVAGDPTFDRTRRATLRYQFDSNRRALGLSGGVEFTHERAENSFVTGPDFADKLPISRNDTGFFVEARPVLGQRAFVTAGLRVERISRDALAGDGSPFGRPTGPGRRRRLVRESEDLRGVVRPPGRRRTHVRLRLGLDEDPRRRRHRDQAARRRSRSASRTTRISSRSGAAATTSASNRRSPARP